MNPPDARPHPWWERTVESAEFFMDEDRLRLFFYVLAAGAAALLILLGLGLWRLRAAALALPVIVGVSDGWVFTGAPQGPSALRESDFDRQFADTLEVLFGRTEKGLPPAIGEFCAPEVVASVDRGYGDAAVRYPAGYVQTLTLLEAKPRPGRPGLHRVYYRGLLSSRSVRTAQTSPIYLDCVFALAGPAPLNAAGWRLVRVTAITREEFYRDEREKSDREALGLPSPRSR
ncbi:MAG: hypothetical protein ACREFX_01675 [Opitutaceae bacterium]